MLLTFTNSRNSRLDKYHTDFQHADKFVSGLLAFIGAVFYQPILFQQSMFKNNILSYAFKMRQDYLSTSCLDKIISPE